MTRFARQAAEAGVITPRSSSPPQPAGHARPARLLGAAGMITLTALLFWLLTDDTFRVTDAGVTFDGLENADEAAVRSHLAGLDRSPNVFRVRASDLVADLRALPGVESALATVTLPANVTVEVKEREPIFAWSDGEATWLVDRQGMLFAPGPAPLSASDATALPPVDGSGLSDDGSEPGDQRSEPSTDDPASPAPSAGPLANAAGGDIAPVEAASFGLAIVEDGRLLEEPPTMGSHLPAADLEVMRQLLALTPELLGSRASSLQLRVDQRDGYVLSSDRGWQAIFGHYAPTLQPPGVVPRQVQCLRWLLASEERQLERVRLAVSDDGCGAFTRLGRPD